MNKSLRMVLVPENSKKSEVEKSRGSATIPVENLSTELAAVLKNENFGPSTKMRIYNQLLQRLLQQQGKMSNFKFSDEMPEPDPPTKPVRQTATVGVQTDDNDEDDGTKRFVNSLTTIFKRDSAGSKVRSQPLEQIVEAAPLFGATAGSPEKQMVSGMSFGSLPPRLDSEQFLMMKKIYLATLINKHMTVNTETQELIDRDGFIIPGSNLSEILDDLVSNEVKSRYAIGMNKVIDVLNSESVNAVDVNPGLYVKFSRKHGNVDNISRWPKQSGRGKELKWINY